MITLTEIPGNKEEDLYVSSEKKSVIALLARGHSAQKIEADRDTLYFSFLQDSVEEDLRSILSGQDIKISVHSLFAAETVWQINISEMRNRAGR